MGGGKFVPGKSKIRGENSPGFYCRNKSFFCNAVSQIFRQKILDKVINSNRINGYKISITSHVHKLSCNLCKKTIEINCPFNILSQYIETNTGFTLTKHDIDISGICNECKNKN